MAWVKDPVSGFEIWVKAAEPEQVQATEPGALAKTWEAVNTPLLPMATHAAGLPSMGETMSEGIDKIATPQPHPPSDEDTPELKLARMLGALELKAVRGGMKGLGTVMEGLTSPLNLAFGALGTGAGAAREGAAAAMTAGQLARAAKLERLAAAARGGEAALSLPVIGEGARNVVKGETPGEKALGALEAAGGLAGLTFGLGGAARGAGAARTLGEAEEALAGATAVGRPLTRRRFQGWLLQNGVDGSELTGKSATQLRAMIEERGGDPTKLLPPEELGPVEGETLVPPSAGVPRVNAQIGQRVEGPGGRTGTIITVDPVVLAREGQVSVIWDEGGVGTMGVDKLAPSETPQPRARRRSAGKSTAEPAPAAAPEPEVTETLAPGPEVAPEVPAAAPKKASAAEIAWHPELGTVQVVLTKGEEALVLPERGKQRLVRRSDLKAVPPEALEPGIVDVEKPAPEIGGQAQLTEAEKAEFGVEDRAPREEPAPRTDIEGATVNILVPEGTPLPTTTKVQPIERQILTGKEGLHAGPTVDGESYEVRIEDPRVDAAQRTVTREIGSSPVGQRLIRLINSMTGQLNEYAGRVMAQVPGLSAREATGLAVSPFRGFMRKLNTFGTNYHFMYGDKGGFNIDPWSLAEYVDDSMSHRWSSDVVFKHIPEDLKARVQQYRGQPISALPAELQKEVKASLWLARLRQTVVHEPIHNVVGTEHTEYGAVSTLAQGSPPSTAIPDRFDVLFKNILKVPEVWASPEYRAMQSPNLRRELVEMYETFRTSADGSPPGTPPPPPPPPGEPPRPPSPIPSGPLSPEDALKVKLRELFAKQRIGRVEQNMKNIALHAEQAKILERFHAKVIGGEMTAVEAQAKQMEALEGLATRYNTVEAPTLTAAEMESVQQQLARAPWTASIFQKMRAARAFERAMRGEQLQEAELRLLSGFFPKEVAGYEPGVFRAIMQQLLKLHGSLRALVTSYDLSAAGRQGLLLTVGHPLTAAKAFRAQLRAFVSERNFEQIEASLLNNPMRNIQEAAGLHLSQPSERVLSTGLGTPEEFFENATYAEKVPGVRASERAYITYLNKMRSEVFNKIAYEMMRAGKTIETNPQEFVDLARAINTMSGRGKIEAMFVSPKSPIGRGLGLSESLELGSKLGEPAVPLLNVGFFAPRFMASRLAILRDLPLLYTNYSGPARQLLMRDVSLTISAGLSALAFAKAMGANVELDMRSSDFGKVRIGKTRYDPWGGFQPWVRFWAQMATGQRKPIRPGRLGLEPVSRLDLLYRFGEQKLSPSFGAAADILRGRTFTGDQLKFVSDEFPYAGHEVWSRVLPLVAQDIYEVAQQGDLEQLLLSVPASTLGIGVQTHTERRGR